MSKDIFNNSEPSQQVMQLMRRLDRLQRKFIGKRLSDMGSIWLMYRYIMTIGCHPGCSQDFIADFHAVDKSRVARVASTFEEKGYITRTPDESDRRSNCLYLTESGKAFFDRVVEIEQEWSNYMTQDIAGEELKETVDTLLIMVKNVENEYDLEKKE